MRCRSAECWILSAEGGRLGTLFLLFAVVPALGQMRDASSSGAPATDLPQVQGLWDELRKLGDWNQQAALIDESLDRQWRENEWNSEADQFARRAAGEVSHIPPWNFSERIGKMTELVAERYAFTDAQRARFQAAVYSEAGGLLIKNYKVLWEQTKEFIAKSNGGEPFTPELVARWARELDPLVADARERLDRMAQGLEQTMTPAQRAILRRDLESLERRKVFFDNVRQRWAEGGWEPADFGLARDPLYTNWRPNPQYQELQRRRAAEEAARRRQEQLEAVNETAWERYVRRFVAEYELDPAQRETAYSILRELQARADDYRTSHRAELAPLTPEALANDPLGAPLARMFEELKARLDIIPTAAQRAAGRNRRSDAADQNPPRQVGGGICETGFPAPLPAGWEASPPCSSPPEPRQRRIPRWQR